MPEREERVQENLKGKSEGERKEMRGKKRDGERGGGGAGQTARTHIRTRVMEGPRPWREAATPTP